MKRYPEYQADLSHYWKLHDSKVEFGLDEDSLWIDGHSGFYLDKQPVGWRASTRYYASVAELTLRLWQRFPFDDVLSLLRGLSQLGLTELGVRVGSVRLTRGILVAMFSVLKMRQTLEDASVTLPENHVYLEIGAGSGWLAALWKTVYPNSRIIILDLPSVIQYSSYMISKCFPDSRILFYCDWDSEMGIDTEHDFVLLPHTVVGAIPPNSVHIVANVASMQEMHIDTVRMYFREIRRMLCAPGLFYCFNRDAKNPNEFDRYTKNVMCESAPTRFDEYPYVEADQHMLNIPEQYGAPTAAERLALSNPQSIKSLFDKSPPMSIRFTQMRVDRC